MNISKSIWRLKGQIYEKQKLIDEHIKMGGWNNDAYHALLSAEDTIKDLKMEKVK